MIVLCILDGFGLAPPGAGNAIELANKPNFDRLWANSPHTTLAACGLDVGLPVGVMGNSEVGHLNIGAGRIVGQDLVRIDQSIADGSFFRNPVLLQLMADTKRRGGDLHLVGLLSDGRVHSSLDHLMALLRMAKEQGIPQTWLHAILDGRDTDPHAGVRFLKQLQESLKKNKYGRIASVVGRYWAMDRDKRWERLERAYRLFTQGTGERTVDLLTTVVMFYNRGITDEFMEPIVLCREDEMTPLSVIKDRDSVLHFNFRADRARELTWALTDDDFPYFARHKLNIKYVCMTLYDENRTLPVVFAPISMKNILAEVLADRGLKQLRTAETEKYAHVTYFFNGGIEEPFPGEDRVMVPSPKVATYDLQPEMSAPEVTQKVLEGIALGKYAFLVVNFANCDMVGHTGVIPAAIKAVETVDAALGKIVEAIDAGGHTLLVTADHGNSDQMIDPTSGEPFTAHSMNPVPLLIHGPVPGRRLRTTSTRLADIAPTILTLMGIPQPEEMTGRSLFDFDEPAE